MGIACSGCGLSVPSGHGLPVHNCSEVARGVTQKVECVGGPRDGEVLVVDARGATVRLRNGRGGYHVYDVVRLKSGAVELHWEFAPR